MSKLRCGTRVRQRREEIGLSRERLARDADVSTSTVTRLELNNKLPNTVNLLRIARILNLPLDELVADEVEASA
jgi:transcriptional regulator with XRE-family HTH domain